MPPVQTFTAFGLLVRDAFLSPDECRELASAMRRDPGQQATIFGDTAAGEIERDIRRALEVSVTGEQQAMLAARLEALRPELESHFKTPLAVAEEPSFVRYPQGAFYRAHRDSRKTPDAADAHRRAVSVVIFVNGPRDVDGFSGGHLRFYGLMGDGPLADVGIDAEPAGGALIAFRSDVLHEVTTVEDGERLSVVTWFVQRR